MAKKNPTFLIGRDAKTGELIPVSEARRRPGSTTVERMPKKGHGDTGRGVWASRQTGWTGLIAKLLMPSAGYAEARGHPRRRRLRLRASQRLRGDVTRP